MHRARITLTLVTLALALVPVANASDPPAPPPPPEIGAPPAPAAPPPLEQAPPAMTGGQTDAPDMVIAESVLTDAPGTARPGTTCTTKPGARVCSTRNAAGTLVRRCVTRGTTRTCEHHRGGRAVRRCVRRGGRERCALLRHAAAAPAWQGFMSAPVAAVGRLTYTTGRGSASSCSATVVARNVLITAGHCVYTLAGGASTNFRFVPGHSVNVNGYAYPVEPYGAWYGGTAYAAPGWTAAQNAGRWDEAVDYAYIVLGPDAAGRQIGNVVGWFGVLANVNAANHWVLGYPSTGSFAEARYGGGYGQYACNTANQAWRTSAGGWAFSVPCAANQGVSGGSFLTQWNGAWYVNSVVSTCSGPVVNGRPCQLIADSVQGAWFDQRVLDLFAALPGRV